MQQLMLIAVLLACPVSMMFMMQRGHGHSMSHDSHMGDTPTLDSMATQDAHIEQLEREVAGLRRAVGGDAPRFLADGRRRTPHAPTAKASRHVH